MSVDPTPNYRRHLDKVNGAQSTFGDTKFGQLAENFARFFGTPKFIIGQTIIVSIWILINAAGFIVGWDKYPFILLNLAFSTQAAYAAPLILLAQTRQATRDKSHAEATAKHNQEESDQVKELIEINTELTESIARLTKEIHHKIDS